MNLLSYFNKYKYIVNHTKAFTKHIYQLPVNFKF